MVFDPNYISLATKPTRSTPGGRASGVGKMHEDAIVSHLMHFKLDYKQQVHFPGIYPGRKTRVDFLVTGIPPWEEGLIIESKNQGSPGSADEKFPYMVANIKEKYPHPCVILYSLDGAGRGALEWLLSQKDGVRLIEIIKYDKFPTWLYERMRPYE